MQVQRALGSDIAMVFDECTPYPATEREARASMELSLRWSSRSRRAFDAEAGPGALFGIVQGGMDARLRLASLAGLEDIGFAGLAIGGLSVGEPAEERERVLGELLPRHAGRQAALPDGRRPSGGPGRVGRRGRRSLRLRGADAPCAERPSIRFLGRHEHPQCPLRRGHGARRPGLWSATPAGTTRAPTCGTSTAAGKCWDRASRRCTTCTTTWH